MWTKNFVHTDELNQNTDFVNRFIVNFQTKALTHVSVALHANFRHESSTETESCFAVDSFDASDPATS